MLGRYARWIFRAHPTQTLFHRFAGVDKEEDHPSPIRNALVIGISKSAFIQSGSDEVRWI